ncbi:MAG: fucose isomerase [Clostridia bacterium]|nr:fucose isomerase [Clostridia bacterium]
MYNQIKMGFCPIGKFVFSHEDAKKQKALIESKMTAMGINYIGLDDILKDGIVRTYEDAGLVLEFFKRSQIDCLFMPHCNFGTESAAGLIARDIGAPVLLWGPRDGAPLEDGTRLRDSLCGMFATSKVLKKLGVKFSYIENCSIDDRAFEKGLDRFIRASNVVRKFKNCRIGMAGNRIDFFWSTIINESELLRRFGIEVLPIDLARVIMLTKQKAGESRNEYIEESKRWANEIDISEMSGDAITNVLALRDVLLEFARENRLSAIAVESFMTIIEELGACISFAMALVSDSGIPCVCESDIHGAISSVIAEAAGLGSKPSFFADLTIRHPDNENGLLLWHDAFPLSLKDPACSGKLAGHWILPGFKPGMAHWKLRDGDITIVRFDGEDREYRLLAKEASTIQGPFTQNTYVWVEMAGWKEFEKKVIDGPYIHHTSCIYGKYHDVLMEACKFIDGIEFDG